MEVKKGKVEIPCSDCAASFCAESFELLGRSYIPVRSCSQCIAGANAKRAVDEIQRAAEKIQRRHLEWLKVCPREYQRCDPAKLPSDRSREALQLALAWDKSPPKPGLGIAGPESGLGKTRIAHAAAHRHFMGGSKVITSIGAAEFSIECSSRWGAKLTEWLSPLCKTAILLIDDLGKERAASEHVASVVYQLIEARTRHQYLPILFTTNHSVIEIQSPYGGRYGEYIVRRLRDYCHFINVDRENAA